MSHYVVLYSFILHPIQCAFHSVHCAVSSILALFHCAHCVDRFRLHSAYFAFHSIIHVIPLCTLRFISYTIYHYSLYNVQISQLCTLCCTLFTPHHCIWILCCTLYITLVHYGSDLTKCELKLYLCQTLLFFYFFYFFLQSNPVC